jgi:hemerythrin superfamily protein
MNSALSRASPSITSMIRMDHTHVIALLHRYKLNAPPGKKRALATNACLAIEIHAQLEEEIFYPSLRTMLGGDQVLGKSVPEHEEMRRLIGLLRKLEPGDVTYDEAFMELMRNVLHHVADEETVLLPAAERILRDQLGELGIQMTRRRMELLKPHLGEVAASTARSFPTATVLAGAGALAVGALLLGRRGQGYSLRRH